MPGFHEDTFPVPKILVDWLGWLKKEELIILIILVHRWYNIKPRTRVASVEELTFAVKCHDISIRRYLANLKKKNLIEWVTEPAGKGSPRNLYYPSYILTGNKDKPF